MSFLKEEAKPRAVQTLLIYTPTQLEALDKDLQANFNGLKTRRHIERFFVKDGAGSFKHGLFHINPARYWATDDKVVQWAKWRERKFPFNQRAAYDEMAAERGLIRGEERAMAGVKRSALIEYEGRYGRPYSVGEQHIIEDVPDYTPA